MLINGENYRINVLILCMQSEIAVTCTTLHALLKNSEENVTISVLLNGGESDELRRIAAAADNVRYYCTRHNLGVAGGRNVLLRTRECEGSDIVLILDNDVLPPADYVRRLSTFLVSNRDAGVVGGVVADYKWYARIKNIDDASSAQMSCADIKAAYLDDDSKDKLFHAGISRNYEYAYFSVLPGIFTVLAVLRIFGILRQVFKVHADVIPMLKNNDRFLKSISDGVEKYEVSNVAGCSQAFHKSLLDRIGYLDERFNPYGLEDSDFCIRAIRAGYRNYIDADTWLLHGTDSRHSERDRYANLANIYKGRTVLAAQVLGDMSRARRAMLKLIMTYMLLGILRGPHIAVLETMARMRGYRQALKLLSAEPAAAPRDLDKAKAG